LQTIWGTFGLAIASLLQFQLLVEHGLNNIRVILNRTKHKKLFEKLILREHSPRKINFSNSF
jgi:hypothetical protein